MNSSNTTTKLLAAVVVLQGVILLGQWTGQGPVTPAHAQVPDAGSQRREIIDELKLMNGKLDRLGETLKSGDMRVSVNPAEKK